MAKYNPNSVWKSPKREEIKPSPVQEKSPPVVQAAAAPNTAASEPFFKKMPIGHFDEPQHKKSNVVWWSLGIFVVLLGGGAGYFFLRPAPGPNVSIGFT